MNIEERVINVVHCGDPKGWGFDDRISIVFTPRELTLLILLFKALGMDAKEYGIQTEVRELDEAFNQAYVQWEDKRRSINE